LKITSDVEVKEEDMEHIRKKVAEMEKKNKFSNVDAEAL